VGRLRALGLAATALAFATAAQGAAPPRPTGGLRFGPATLADPLDPVASPVLRVGGAGSVLVTGRPARLLRSTDGGDSFRATGGLDSGASDVVEAEGTIVVAVESFGSVAIFGSDDGGSTWRLASVEPITGVTRPWLAADGATIFLAVTTPAGTEIFSSGRSELSFADAGVSGPESPSTRCGRLVFDPVRRNLYLPCARGSEVLLTTGHVQSGRRSGIVFTTAVAARSPAGPVGGPLPSLAVDAAGAVYVVWVEGGTSSLYAAQPGSSPVLVNGAGADVTALPAAVGGAPGTFAVAFLGAETEIDPNTLPDVRSDPRAAAAVRWYGYTVLVRDLTSASADVVQQRTTSKPVHFGRLCTTCTADPVLGDAIGVGLEPATGALRIALADASGPTHVPQAVVVRQLEGPTALGQSLAGPAPANGVVDGAGDAPGAPALDVTKLELRQLNPSTLRVRMSVGSTAALAPPPGSTTGIWLTRFQILSRGGAGEATYRSLYAAAITAGGQSLRFAAGEIACAEDCRPASVQVPSGRVEGNAIVVDVNLVALSRTVPLEGDLLYNVSGFTFGGDHAGNPSLLVDSLAPFDYRLDQRIGPTTGRGRRITLHGTIPAGAGRRASVAIAVRTNRTGTIAYRDSGARVVFRATRIARVTVRRGTITIAGMGLNAARPVSFVATLVDRRTARDSFGIRLSTGYRRAGRLLTGSVRIA
jgi:hypothetical protein